MADRPLQGVGVLVTRPRTQVTELVNAIEEQGGRAYCFPVMEIVPFDEIVVEQRVAEMAKPDVVIFISPNAVEYGIQHTDGGQIAVIGPSTAKAVEAAGRVVDIQPSSGYDSEHLLAEAALQNIAGKHVRIIRGTSGRELLAEALTGRGATVDYLPVYERHLPAVGPETLADLESRWRQGEINVVTVMSVQSLRNLAKILPAWCSEQLESTPLVTPAGRVLKEALDSHPGSRPILAPGPSADDMVRAIIAIQGTESGIAP